MSLPVLYTRSILLLFCLFSLSTGFAQIEEIPLTGNPEVVRAYERLNTPIPAPAHAQQRGTGGTKICVASGDTTSLCVDTTGIGANATVSIVDCGTLLFGTVIQDSACIRYHANAGIILESEDVCLEVCDSAGNCSTTTFTVTIHRPLLKDTAALTVMDIEDEKEICLTPDANFGTPVYSLVGNVDRQTGTVITLNNCFRYESTRFAGLDHVIYQARYSECVNDLFIHPIQIVTDTIGLPFFDDFSYPGPYPDPTKWLDNKAFVNDRMAYQPPSIGVATLDGVDERGKPYPIDSTYRDVLTSAYFDFSGYTENDNILFSFWAQPKGLGFRPETKDSLVVEFKDVNGIWQVAEQIQGYLAFVPSDSLAPFVYRAYGIGQPEYLYNGFQFRFRNRSDLTGALDLWHIDYVRMDKNLTKENEDIAFTSRPNPLLKTYTAMPWNHFLNAPNSWLVPQLEIGLYNHFTVVESANPSEVKITDRLSAQTLVSNITLLELPPIAPVNQRDLSPGRHNFVNTLNAPNLVADLQGFPSTGPGVDLDVVYRFEQDQEQNAGEPVALRNNEVHYATNLTNYFAYDDGSAESAIVATKTGTQVAVQYEATVADTLRAIQFHFPRYNVDATEQYFNLRIWSDTLNSVPIYEDFFLKPFYPDLVFADSLQAFTTYVLYDEDGNAVGVPLPKGTFFVGWQQGSNVDNSIPVGYDKNNPTGSQHAWLNTQGSWAPFPVSLQGALMIRPVVGSQTPTNTPDLADVEHPLEASLKIYPNPSQGMIYLDAGIPTGKWSIQVMDIMGRNVVSFPWSAMVDLDQLPSGWYALMIRDEDGRPIARRQIIMQD
ncbi:MAG: T9SS type A sorting domain-containing protein [Saprospiraceae bacterium]|nr:T9SS type A sorting domain-containing protein [Saprospiraceae bacterium]